VTVLFQGYITMNGPGTVTYRIVRSDGAMGPIESLAFPAAGSQPVITTWTLGDASILPTYAGWVALRVLTPNPVESDHASAQFMMTCSGQAPPAQPQRANFRISLAGFTCNRETRDAALGWDGSGDEIFQSPVVLDIDRSGGTFRSIGAFGPVFGDIHTGRRFPTSTPCTLSTEPVGLGIPGVLFDGELIEGEKAVLIYPTIWERDVDFWTRVEDNSQLRDFWDACARRSRDVSIFGHCHHDLARSFAAAGGKVRRSVIFRVHCPGRRFGQADRSRHGT
jgi:hypothetical protein